VSGPATPRIYEFFANRNPELINPTVHAYVTVACHAVSYAVRMTLSLVYCDQCGDQPKHRP